MANEKQVESEEQKNKTESQAKKQPVDLDLDHSEVPEENTTPSSGLANKQISLKLVLFFFVGLLFVIGMSVGLTLWLLGKMPDKEVSPVSQDMPKVEEIKEPDPTPEVTPVAPSDSTVQQAPSYIPVGHPFVVNLVSSDSGSSSHLMIEVALLFRGADQYSTLNTHMPLVRNQLMLYFGEEKNITNSIDEVRQTLKKGALIEVNKVLKKEIGKAPIEEVLFTSFVMQ